MEGVVYRDSERGVIWADGYYSCGEQARELRARSPPLRCTSNSIGTPNESLTYLGNKFLEFLPKQISKDRTRLICNLIEITLESNPQFPASMLPLHREGRRLSDHTSAKYKLYFLSYGGVPNEDLKQLFDSAIKHTGFNVRNRKEYYDTSSFEVMMQSGAEVLSRDRVLLTTDEISAHFREMAVKVKTLYIRARA